MKIRVHWFGRRGQGAWDEQVETYRQRVQRRWPAEDRPLKPFSGGRSDDPRRALLKEAQVIRQSLEPGWPLVVLDEKGRQATSEDFARRLADFEDRSTPGLDFVVGSDLGLARELTEGAKLVLSLSPMTLPHQIARLLVWEQLFRATHILGGGGYHRGDANS